MEQGKLKKASESELAGAIREAIGAGPDDEVSFVTPQFTRERRATPPGSPPASREQWDALLSMSDVGLREMGLRPWDEPDEQGRVTMLLPGEWYRAIPAGFPIVGLNGEEESFVPRQSDNDIRFGCLAYGVRVKATVNWGK